MRYAGLFFSRIIIGDLLFFAQFAAMRVILLFCLLCFGGILPGIAQDVPMYPEGEEWNMIKVRDGVTAYTRKVESRILKEFRITCIIDQSYDKVYTFMHNPDNFASWCAPVFPDFKIAGTAEDGGFYSYLVVPTPFFTKDRDIIFYNIIKDISNGFIMRLTAAPNYLPEKPNYVRVQTALAVMTFIKKSDTQVECQYRGSVDPAGELPERFANLTAYNLPLENILALKRVLEAQ